MEAHLIDCPACRLACFRAVDCILYSGTIAPEAMHILRASFRVATKMLLGRFEFSLNVLL